MNRHSFYIRGVRGESPSMHYNFRTTGIEWQEVRKVTFVDLGGKADKMPRLGRMLIRKRRAAYIIK